MASNQGDKLPKIRREHSSSSLLAIVAEGFLSRISFGIVTFALPLYAYHLGLSVLQISFLVTLTEAAALVVKPIMGWIGDRYGLKRIYTTSLGLRSLVTLLIVLTRSPWQLYVIKSVHGMSKAMRKLSAHTLIAEQGGKKAIASAFAWYHTAKIVAGSLGKALAGLLLTLTASNFSLVFTVSFLLSALPLYTVVRYVDDDRPSHRLPRHKTTEKTRNTDQKASKASVSTVIKAKEITGLEVNTEPVILPFTILTFLINGTAAMLKGLFPILAIEYAGLSEAQTGSIYMISTLSVLVSGPFFGWLSDRGNREFVLLVRSISNTISSIMYLFAPNFYGLAAGKLVDKMGKAAFRPAWGSLMAHVSSYDKSRRAQIMSWILVGEDAGTIAGPLLAGLLWSTWGLTVMLSARVVLAIITEVYVTMLNRSLEEKDRKQIKSESPITQAK